MRAYAERELRSNRLGEGDLQRFASDTLSYTIKQLGRLARFFDDDTDLLAWPARNLFETLLLARYTLASPERVTEFMLRCVKDYQHLQNEWSASFPFDPTSEAETAYTDSLTALSAAIAEEDLSLPPGKTNIRALADTCGLIDLYRVGYPLLSKYVHPTPLQFMGDKTFLHGEEARRGILTFGQYSAALLLEEMPGKIEDLIPSFRGSSEAGTAGS